MNETAEETDIEIFLWYIRYIYVVYFCVCLKCICYVCLEAAIIGQTHRGRIPPCPLIRRATASTPVNPVAASGSPAVEVQLLHTPKMQGKSREESAGNPLADLYESN
jgi:hypothetical protein